MKNKPEQREKKQWRKVRKRRKIGMIQYEVCRLCPRECGVNRLEGQSGYCGMDGRLHIARAALHMWEEPCISGEKGSGAVFFSGCSLRCCFCQNREIAEGGWGEEITVQRLADIFLELEQQGAANVNLVTAGHYAPHVVRALEDARRRGMSLPVVYNCGGYEKIETLKLLEGYVDVYLPDYKYAERELAGKLSGASDYPDIAREAIGEMVQQTGSCEFDGDGYIRRGTIVRHLILPGHTKNSVKALEMLHRTWGNRICISIMNQYTPVCPNRDFPELNRRVTGREYEKVLNRALELGIENGYFQEGETAKESFIPKFDCSGVKAVQGSK